MQQKKLDNYLYSLMPQKMQRGGRPKKPAKRIFFAIAPERISDEINLIDNRGRVLDKYDESLQGESFRSLRKEISDILNSAGDSIFSRPEFNDYLNRYEKEDHAKKAFIRYLSDDIAGVISDNADITFGNLDENSPKNDEERASYTGRLQTPIQDVLNQVKNEYGVDISSVKDLNKLYSGMTGYKYLQKNTYNPNYKTNIKQVRTLDPTFIEESKQASKISMATEGVPSEVIVLSSKEDFREKLPQILKQNKGKNTEFGIFTHAGNFLGVPQDEVNSLISQNIDEACKLGLYSCYGLSQAKDTFKDVKNITHNIGNPWTGVPRFRTQAEYDALRGRSFADIMYSLNPEGKYSTAKPGRDYIDTSLIKEGEREKIYEGLRVRRAEEMALRDLRRAARNAGETPPTRLPQGFDLSAYLGEFVNSANASSFPSLDQWASERGYGIDDDTRAGYWEDLIGSGLLPTFDQWLSSAGRNYQNASLEELRNFYDQDLASIIEEGGYSLTQQPSQPNQPNQNQPTNQRTGMVVPTFEQWLNFVGDMIREEQPGVTREELQEYYQEDLNNAQSAPLTPMQEPLPQLQPRMPVLRSTRGGARNGGLQKLQGGGFPNINIPNLSIGSIFGAYGQAGTQYGNLFNFPAGDNPFKPKTVNTKSWLDLSGVEQQTKKVELAKELGLTANNGVWKDTSGQEYENDQLLKMAEEKYNSQRTNTEEYNKMLPFGQLAYGSMNLQDMVSQELKNKKEKIQDFPVMKSTYAPKGFAEQGGAINYLQQLMGYKDNSPYKNLPYQDIYSDRITMKGVSQPLLATTDNGISTVMQPGGEYYFPGASVVREKRMDAPPVPTPDEDFSGRRILRKMQHGGQNKYTTKLTPKEEKEFRAWYNRAASYKGLDPNPDSPNQYYDYRGFWKNEDRDKILTDDPKVHFYDTYKKPGHPTFSNQSKYSTDKTPGGTWSLSEDGTYFFTHSPYTEKYANRTTEYLKGTGENSILRGDTIYSIPKLPLKKMQDGGKIKTFSNDPEWFNSQTFDNWTIKQLRTGKYGVDPESGALYKLKKPVKVPQEFLDLTSENPSDTETARRGAAFSGLQTAYQNPAMQAPGIIGLGGAMAPTALRVLNTPIALGRFTNAALTPQKVLSAVGAGLAPFNAAEGVKNIQEGNYAEGAADLALAGLDLYVPELLGPAGAINKALKSSMRTLPNIEELRRIFHNQERILSEDELIKLTQEGRGVARDYIDPSYRVDLSNPEQANIWDTNLDGLRRIRTQQLFSTPSANLGSKAGDAVKNKSELTKKDVLGYVNLKDKDKVSKMTDSEFSNTVLKPNGEIVPYSKDIPEKLSKNITPISNDEFITEFNQNIDRLNEIINRRNSTGIQYKVKELTPDGRLIFETPPQPISSSTLAEDEEALRIFESDPVAFLVERGGLRQTDSGNWVLDNLDPLVEFQNLEDVVSTARSEINNALTPSQIEGTSYWDVYINPGRFTGDVEDIASTEYLRDTLPGLNMIGTGRSVFPDRVARKGSGAYESINEYLKELGLGRVKSGFNSQTNSSLSAWQNFVNSGRGVGFYGGPFVIHGALKNWIPGGIALGALMGTQENQEDGEVQNKKQGGMILSKKRKTPPVPTPDNMFIMKNGGTMYANNLPNAKIGKKIGNFFSDLGRGWLDTLGNVTGGWDLDDSKYKTNIAKNVASVTNPISKISGSLTRSIGEAVLPGSGSAAGQMWKSVGSSMPSSQTPTYTPTPQTQQNPLANLNSLLGAMGPALMTGSMPNLNSFMSMPQGMFQQGGELDMQQMGQPENPLIELPMEQQVELYKGLIDFVVENGIEELASQHPQEYEFFEMFNDYLDDLDEEEEVQEEEPMSPEEMANGGIPQRYKNLGFSKVGQKRQSTRPGKKWMVLAKKGDQYKVVHGGAKGMSDFTKHKNEKRRNRFWDRMGGKSSAKATDPFSPLYWHKRFKTW